MKHNKHDRETDLQKLARLALAFVKDALPERPQEQEQEQIADARAIVDLFRHRFDPDGDLIVWGRSMIWFNGGWTGRTRQFVDDHEQV